MRPDIHFFRSLSEELNPERLQRKFLESLLELQGVSRGSIWIRKDQYYLCVEAAGRQRELMVGVRIPAGQPSIAGWVIEKGKMTIAEPEKDGRHYREAEKGFDVKSSLILCFPLLLRDGRVYGAVQIIDTDPRKTKLNLESSYLSELQGLIDIGSVALSNAIRYHQKLEETESLKQTLEQIQGQPTLIGQSPAFLRSRELMEEYARTDYAVLITGESGTGKELFARRIHQMSRRSAKPLMAQNCSAIPETLLESELFGYTRGAFSGADKDRMGLFEAADGGTLFLDEIGDMPLKLQARILRVIQDGEVKPLGSNSARQVDVRIVAATHRNLPDMVGQKLFREDLYYRLSVLPLTVPTLRERREDVPLLLRHFMRREALKMGAAPKRFAPEVLDLLQTYGWGGNIRELENFVRYILVTAETDLIGKVHLPGHMTGSGQRRRRSDMQHPPDGSLVIHERTEKPTHLDFGDRTWEDVDREYILFLMDTHRWNITRAAQTANVNRSTFASRMRRLGIRKSS
ncbi:MAG: sigma 54-interacting transcriptional regulator [Desulfobacterales bacterium]|nr:sigma 54-interacting transcriptional regulator [Desulfobacterales bacterium]